MKDFLTKILDYYGLSYDDYVTLLKEPSYDLLKSPYDFEKIEEISNYLKLAIDNKKKILIYGDYDCDGIMATSIIFNMLHEYKNYIPGFYIPNREIDGYGLTINNINKFKALNYDLIICVDNGITLVKEIDYLNSLNIESVIIDHHTKEEELPKANYILHPVVSNFDNINMSAGAVCFYLSRVFLGYDNDYLLTLGMISTISDLMELKGNNREIVRLGLKKLNEHKYLNIVSLLTNKNNITENDLSMNLIPKINAIGRIALDNSIFNIVRFFTTDDEQNIKKRIKWIEENNIRRKELINNAMNEAIVDSYSSSIIEILDIKEGLCGLVANKFLDTYKKPAIVLTFSNDKEIIKGSIRSKNGLNVIEALNELKDLLITSGGHAQAGGLSLKYSDFEEFKDRFNEYAKNHPFVEEKKNYYIDINISEINLQNIDILNSFRPFGMGFDKPEFKLDSFNTNEFTFSRDHKHIITNLSFKSSLIYFNFDSNIFNYNNVILYGKLELNEFNGYRSAQFIVNSFEKK